MKTPEERQEAVPDLPLTCELPKGLGRHFLSMLLARTPQQRDGLIRKVNFHRPELAQINPGPAAMVALAGVMSDAYMRGDAPGEEVFESHARLLSILGLQPGQLTAP